MVSATPHPTAFPTTSGAPDQATDGRHPPVSGGAFVAVRLEPGDDLIVGIQHAREQVGSHAMAVVTCVGSLTDVLIRHANRPEGTHYRGPFEITSLVGTVDPRGEHLHLTITDSEGQAFGGHLLPGSSVHTTAEIVLLLLTDLTFTRAPCPRSGYDELVVTAAEPGNSEQPREG